MFNRFRFHLLLAVCMSVHFAIWGQPVAGFNITVPTSNCNPAVYSFENTSTGTGLSYQWNFGVYPGVNSIFSDPSTTYLNCGTFQVKLVVTDVNGLKDSIVQPVNVRCSPTASFTTPAAIGCSPYSATFNSTSIAGSGTITNYIWDFGDGNSGTGMNPSHTYLVPGCKNVTLIVTNSFNCMNDTTRSSFLCINQPPVSSFTSNAQAACAPPFNVNYTATSSSGTSPYSYQWQFQGGVPDTASSVNANVTYNAAGSFTTTLITRDANGCADTATGSDYIIVDTNYVDFTIGTGLLCAPTTTTVNGFSSAVPLSWSWTVSAPATITDETTPNASITFPDSGSYNICLTTVFSNGCSAQKCSTIVVNPAPVADFTTTGSTTCVAPYAVVFADSSTGSNLTHSWSFPGGLPDTATSSTPPPISYDTCGNYSVLLTVTDNVGCRSTANKTNFLQITCPEAKYTVTPSDGCLPLTATFNSDSSTGNPVSWLWDFDDPNSGANNTSTLQNPQHTFNTEGCYTVKLTTTNALGCTAFYELPAAVCAGSRPQANFSANPPLNCASQPIYFTDSSTGTYAYTKYYWSFRDSIFESYLQNPNYTYWDAGIFDITLIVSNYGCADTLTKDDYVRTLFPLSSPRAITDCNDPLSVTLDGRASPGANTYEWIILGGTPSYDTTSVVIATFPAPGDYNVSLHVVNDTTGCDDLQNIVVHVSTVGADFIASPLAGCEPLQSCFSNTSINALSYQWTVTDSTGAVDTTTTDGSPCFTFNKAGIYSVQLIVTDSSGCVDTLYKPDYITVSHPVANFSSNPLTGCAPLAISFLDSSVATGANIVQWNWNFGDVVSGSADSSSLRNAVHTFNNGGDFPVSLIATDSLGCSSDTIKYVHVNKPIASYRTSSTLTCSGKQTCFTADMLGQSVTHHWDLGDGSTSDSSYICHFYSAPGVFNVMLVATDTIGCKDTVTATENNPVHVLDAQFTADTTTSTCPPLVVSFSNLSTGADSLTLWRWNFGDGQVSSLKDPFHIYTAVGKYTVTLIATNAAGCADTLIYPDYIDITGPSAFIATPPTSGCVPHETCMSAISTTAIAYTWNLGDGMVIKAGDSICYTYTRTGSFYPELILNNSANCVFSLPMGRVDVTGAVAKFGQDDSTLCGAGTVNFADSSSGTSPVTNWNWSFGDTASGTLNHSTQKNPFHFFASPGNYQVVEMITSANGCVDSTQKIIAVFALPAPTAGISDTTPCAPDSVLFYGQVTNIGAIINHFWNFGDAQSGSADTSSLRNPVHYYSTVGTYPILYTVTDTHGCIGIDSVVVYVQPLPVAAFTAFDTCLNTQPISFSNNSLGANYFSWSFGDGDTSTLLNATHTYRDSGIYTAQLIAQNNYCSDTFSTVVEIFSLPVAAFTLPVNASCGPPAQFSIVNNSTNATSYSWDLGNNTFSSLETPVAAYTSAGQFTILLTATNEHGCIDTVSKEVVIHPVPVIQNIDIQPAEGCPPLSVELHANVTNGNSFLWNSGADTSLVNTSSPDAAFVYADTGFYTISLYVRSDFSCQDTMVLTDAIRVHSNPVANFDTLETNTAVYPYDGTVVFTNRSENADNYTWEFGDGATSTEVNPTHRYEEINSYNVLLTAFTAYGCKDTATQEMHVIKKSLYAPNALHPNAEDANDLVKVWKPAGIGLLSYRAQVFDQWGKLLWESEKLENTEPAESWDGNYQGKPCPQDVYVWKIDATFLDGRKWQGMSYSADEGGGVKTIGSITLVR